MVATVKLPLCGAPGCRLCAPWLPLDARDRSLVEAVQVAERMVKSGWLPHEAPCDWDRSELGTRDHPFASLPSSVARDLRALATTAAGPQSRPLLRAPREGVAIGLVGDVPPQPHPAPTTATTSRTRAALYSAIVADVASGVLETGEVSVLGRLFLGPKDRPIYDAAHINDAIPDSAKSVAYGSIRDLCATGTVAVKLDLKAAFRSVPVVEADRRYLGVRVDGVTLRYARLPFGLATSPRLFVEALQRSLDAIPLPSGSSITSYVDDIAICAPSPAVCAELLCLVVRRLIDDGWRVAASKTFGRPTEDLLFLGFRIEVDRKAVALTTSRRDKMLSLVADVAAQVPGWLQALQKLLGVSAWASPALRGSGFVVPPCYRALRNGVLDGEARDALGVLAEIIREAIQPSSLLPPTSHIAVVTDASDGGWCAALTEGGVVTAVHRGELPSGVVGWSSTAREAVAVAEAIRAFALPLLSGVGVQVTTDSSQ